ncbi:hypothetical protein [Streptomyces sp. LPB2020-019-1HS]|uniref:hypothetical protein n=1 Tax=Streptomyces sp. LPB2020-019-1HS TaxID=3409689 RepID=UPI003B66C2B6
MADCTVLVLGVPLSKALARQAPRGETPIRLVREAFTTEAAETAPFIDGMIAPPVSRFEVPGLRSVDLFTERWVCVLDATHPYAIRGWLSQSDMAHMDWVAPFHPDPGPMTAAPTTRQLALFGREPDIRVRAETVRQCRISWPAPTVSPCRMNALPGVSRGRWDVPYFPARAIRSPSPKSCGAAPRGP